MNGVPVPVVSRLLGHSDMRMTLRYAHLADKEIEDAAERLELTLRTPRSSGTRSRTPDGRVADRHTVTSPPDGNRGG